MIRPIVLGTQRQTAREGRFFVVPRPPQAAVSHMAVSKALLISGMFMPKFGMVPFFGKKYLNP